MSEVDDLRRRVERLEARHDIAELVSSYAIACDEHDIPRLESLFTEDACFESSNGDMTVQGRDGIVAMFRKILKNRGPGYHWTHDHFVTFDDEDRDRATGLVLSHAETTPDNTVSLSAMRYHDTFRRVNERWYFEKRKISFLYYVPAEQFTQSLNNEMRVKIGDKLYPADYPEALASWQDFEKQE